MTFNYVPFLCHRLAAIFLTNIDIFIDTGVRKCANSSSILPRSALVHYNKSPEHTN